MRRGVSGGRRFTASHIYETAVRYAPDPPPQRVRGCGWEAGRSTCSYASACRHGVLRCGDRAGASRRVHWADWSTSRGAQPQSTATFRKVLGQSWYLGRRIDRSSPRHRDCSSLALAYRWGALAPSSNLISGSIRGYPAQHAPRRYAVRSHHDEIVRLQRVRARSRTWTFGGSPFPAL